MRTMLLVFTALLIFAVFFSGCSTVPTPSPVEPPVIVNPSPTPNPTVYKFKWDNPSWTATMLDQIKLSGMDKLKPKDMEEFGLTEGMDALKFWGNIVVEIAKWESNFKPDATYKEPFRDGRGNRVISSGLFQISIESANNRNRGDCKFREQSELFNPHLNIRCSVKIMTFFIKESNLIRGVNPNRGLARYWSVVRGNSSTHTRNALKAIRAANN